MPGKINMITTAAFTAALISLAAGQHGIQRDYELGVFEKLPKSTKSLTWTFPEDDKRALQLTKGVQVVLLGSISKNRVDRDKLVAAKWKDLNGTFQRLKKLRPAMAASVGSGDRHGIVMSIKTAEGSYERCLIALLLKGKLLVVSGENLNLITQAEFSRCLDELFSLN